MDTSTVTELFDINVFVQHAIAVARDTDSDNHDHDRWATAYGLIFSKACSQRAYALFKTLNVDFDYYDPDTSYQEDVEAFATAFHHSCESIAAFFPSVAKVYFPDSKISVTRSGISI